MMILKISNGKYGNIPETEDYHLPAVTDTQLVSNTLCLKTIKEADPFCQNLASSVCKNPLCVMSVCHCCLQVTKPTLPLPPPPVQRGSGRGSSTGSSRRRRERRKGSSGRGNESGSGKCGNGSGNGSEATNTCVAVSCFGNPC